MTPVGPSTAHTPHGLICHALAHHARVPPALHRPRASYLTMRRHPRAQSLSKPFRLSIQSQAHSVYLPCLCPPFPTKTPGRALAHALPAQPLPPDRRRGLPARPHGLACRLFLGTREHTPFLRDCHFYVCVSDPARTKRARVPCNTRKPGSASQPDCEGGAAGTEGGQDCARTATGLFCASGAHVTSHLLT